jgi:hypothetical protein
LIQVLIVGESVEHGFEQLVLHVGIHADRSIEADETGMQRSFSIFAFRARSIGGATEIDRVLGDERPITVEDDGQQLPILDADLADPADMGAFRISAISGKLGKLLAEAFVDQQLHARRRRATLRSETIVASGASVAGRLGRPRGGVAAA